jgi:hypothetical protein
MKMYELPAGTYIDVIEKNYLLNVNQDEWEQKYASRDSFFETGEFLDYVAVANGRKDSFPEVLREMIKKNKNLVMLRSYHKGKVYFARVSCYQLNYMG